MLKNIILEGVDRTGKDSLVLELQHRLGFMQVLHFTKPLALKAYSGSLKEYQLRSFVAMFGSLDKGGMLLNRAHLGETVYSSRYRSYSGDYVYGLEEMHPTALENTLLVLLHVADWTPIEDDGLSFDVTKREAEQLDFVRAFEKSKIKYKVMIDVTCGQERVPLERLAQAIHQAYVIGHQAPHPIVSITWRPVDGAPQACYSFRPDPRLHV